MKTLIAGSTSGLGKYLHNYKSFVFGNKDVLFLNRNWDVYEIQYNTIIYLININTGKIDDIAANQELLQKYLDLDFKNFVFISSIDALPKSECLYGTQKIDTFEKTEGTYSNSKYESELLVTNICEKRNLKYLILRPSMIVNPFARPNSIQKIKDNNDIRISAESGINCVGVHSIGKFLKYAIKHELSGIFSLTSKYNTKIATILSSLEKELKCGDYVYQTPWIKENPTVKIEPSFGKSSLDVVLDYINYGIY